MSWLIYFSSDDNRYEDVILLNHGTYKYRIMQKFISIPHNNAKLDQILL